MSIDPRRIALAVVALAGLLAPGAARAADEPPLAVGFDQLASFEFVAPPDEAGAPEAEK